MRSTLGFVLIGSGIGLIVIAIGRIYEPAMVSEWFLGRIADYIYYLKPEHVPIFGAALLFAGMLFLWSSSPAR